MHQDKINLDEWFELVSQSYLAPPVGYQGKNLPAFPSDAIQANTTGQSGVATLRDAFIFYKDCLNAFEKFGKPVTESARILDFGVGWGRIARFFLRDMPLENIHGVDVTPEFTEICRDTFQSTNFLTCQPLPPTSMPDSYYDFRFIRLLCGLKVIYRACFSKERRDGKQRTVPVSAWAERTMVGGTCRAGHGAAAG